MTWRRDQQGLEGNQEVQGMTAFLAGWLTVFVVGCLAVVSPGPNMAITLRNSLAHSRAAGTYTAAGLALGDAVHVCYCLVGIAVVISQSILLFNVVKWAGAAYLVYVGIKGVLARKRSPATGGAGGDEGEGARSVRRMGSFSAARSGFFTSLLNSKVTLFFLALFTQVISPDTPLAAKAVYGLTVVGIEFGWFALVALFVSSSPVKRRFDAVSHWVERVTGAFLIALGIRLAFSSSNG